MMSHNLPIVTALCVIDIAGNSCRDDQISEQYVLYAEENDSTYDICALNVEWLSTKRSDLSSTPLRFSSEHQRVINNLRTFAKIDGTCSVVSSSLDGSVLIFEVETSTDMVAEFQLRRVRRFDGHKDSVLAIEIISIPDCLSGHLIVSGGRDCTLMVWDSIRCEETIIFETQHRNASWITCFAIAAIDENPMIGGQDGNKKIPRDSEDTSQLGIQDKFHSSNETFEVDIKEKSLDMLCTKVDLNLRWIHPPPLEEEKVDYEIKANIDRATYEKGKYLRKLPVIASGDEAGRISIWKNGALKCIVKAHSTTVKSASFVPTVQNDDEEMLQLVSGCSGGLLVVSNALSGQLLRIIDSKEGIEFLVPVVYPHAGNALFVYASCVSHALKVFDCRHGRFLSFIMKGESGSHIHYPGTKYFILLKKKKKQVGSTEDVSNLHTQMDHISSSMSSSTSVLDNESLATAAFTLDTSSMVSDDALVSSEYSDYLHDHGVNAKDMSVFSGDNYYGDQCDTIITGQRSDVDFLRSIDIGPVINYWLA